MMNLLSLDAMEYGRHKQVTKSLNGLRRIYLLNQFSKLHKKC